MFHNIYKKMLLTSNHFFKKNPKNLKIMNFDKLTLTHINEVFF